MSIESLLKKEGIKVLKKLNQNEINAIAKDIAIKLCLAFPEHNLNRSTLFDLLSCVNMYFAKIPNDFSGAKYVHENNSIYFNSDLPFEDIPSVAMHECIHLLQATNNINGNTKMGLYDFNSSLGINEAAVQLMASEANLSTPIDVKYFNISLNTISPDYYPLECALLNQITYFTGTFPLYHSVLYSDDMFKNTFITKFDKKAYKFVIKNFDKLLSLEDDLNEYSIELSYYKKPRDIKRINTLIKAKKNEIASLFYKIQNYIMKKCFSYELNAIRNSDDLYEFKHMLYEYKNIIGTQDSYTFYNEFYRNAMESLELKKLQIEKFGEINLFVEECKALTIVDTTKNAFSFFKIFTSKIRKLFRLNQSDASIIKIK